MRRMRPNDRRQSRRQHSCVTSSRRGVGGFSLIELVIVVVIIGIIAAIAIPRMSRGSAAAADSAVSRTCRCFATP